MEDTIAKNTEYRQNYSDFQATLWKYEGEKGSLIPLLQSAQDTYGYIPESAIEYISEIVGVPPSDIYGVITFYAQFRLKPFGKFVIKICDGTACHVNKSKDIIKTLKDELGIENNETTEDGLFTIQEVACLGCCSLAPVVMINEETYGKLTPKKMKNILKEYRDSKK